MAKAHPEKDSIYFFWPDTQNILRVLDYIGFHLYMSFLTHIFKQMKTYSPSFFKYGKMTRQNSVKYPVIFSTILFIKK